jgi:hypothetical protein
MICPGRPGRKLRGRQTGNAVMHDGFRIHENPDGSCVFVEGKKLTGRGRGIQAVWTQEDEAALNACCARRGIVFEFQGGKWY